MYQIINKTRLNNTTVRIDVEAPLVARKAKVGQFIILRAGENSKRIPFTVMDSDERRGSVSIIYQVLGAGTMELDQLNRGDSLHDFVGPLGEPSHLSNLSRVCVVGGGLGCAIAYPSAKQLKLEGAYVDGIIGFRNAGAVLLADEFSAVCDRVTLLTDDGSDVDNDATVDLLCKMALLHAEAGVDFVACVQNLSKRCTMPPS